MLVSIILCSRDRPKYLEGCLNSIKKTQLPLDTEIVFIDNSSDDIKTLRKNKNISDFYNCVYIREPIRGLSRARNTGVRNSTGKYVVFVDDDFLFEKMWLMNILNNFKKNQEVTCCTGRVLPYLHNKYSVLIESFISFDKGCKRNIFTSKDISIRQLIKIAFNNIVKIKSKHIKKRPVPHSLGTAYCCVKKEIFNEIGFFDEALGMGTSSRGGEDVDFLYRILKSGHKIVYDPKSIVFHLHRSSFSDLYLQYYNYGVGLRSFLLKHLKKDMYIFTLFIGTLFYLLISFFRFSLDKNSDLRNLIFFQFLGYLNFYT